MAYGKRRVVKDLEFHVSAGRLEKITQKWGEACEIALDWALSGQTVHIDVVAWTLSAAKAWMGEEGARMYREDPEASVFDRIIVTADSIGRVP